MPPSELERVPPPALAHQPPPDEARSFIPAEAVLTFHLAEPATVTTVSEQEMQRLAYGLPANGVNPQMQRRTVLPAPVWIPTPTPIRLPVLKSAVSEPQRPFSSPSSRASSIQVRALLLHIPFLKTLTCWANWESQENDQAGSCSSLAVRMAASKVLPHAQAVR